MKIAKSNKDENAYAEPFLSWFTFFMKIKKCEAIPENGRLKSPDYLVDNDIFLELKQLYDGTDVKRSAQWGIITNKLQKLLAKRFKKEKLKGLINVETPNIYKLQGNKKFDRVVTDIIDAIKTGKLVVDSYGINFKIEKINEKYNEVYFSSHSEFCPISPAGTIFQNIVGKLKTANSQLGYTYKDYSIKKRIVLLVNKYAFADSIDEVVEGLSYCYTDLLDHKNIDEIYFQQEIRNKTFVHTLVYDRDFITKFDKKEIEPNNKIHQQQFELWYWALYKMGNKQDQLFDALKKFLKNYKPARIFSDKFKRETMVQLGIWLTNNGRTDDTIWLIEKFIDDPDPVEPEKYFGDINFNYHQQIAEGKEPNIITSVLGQLAWVVQKISVKKDCINQALNYTEQLLSHKNLYVKLQAIVPLVEIAGRRQWLKCWGKRPRNGEYKKFHTIVFSLVKLVKRHPQYKAIAKRLCNVFAYYKDLSMEEAEQVLDALQISDGSDGLFIYYAIFRKSHYKNQPIKFGNKIFEQKLEKIVLNSDAKNNRLRGNIVWNIWKIVEEDHNQLKNPELIKYLNLIMTTEFIQETEFGISSIIKMMSDYNPELSAQWLELRLVELQKYSKTHKPQVFVLIEDILDKLRETEKYRSICNLVKELNKSSNVHIRKMKID